MWLVRNGTVVNVAKNVTNREKEYENEQHTLHIAGYQTRFLEICIILS